jgi:hypothetical protein
MAGSCEHGNEPSGSIKGEEFIEYLSDYWLLKKVSTPWSLLIIIYYYQNFPFFSRAFLKNILYLNAENNFLFSKFYEYTFPLTMEVMPKLVLFFFLNKRKDVISNTLSVRLFIASWRHTAIALCINCFQQTKQHWLYRVYPKVSGLSP